MGTYNSCLISGCTYVAMNGGFCFEHAAEVRRRVADGRIRPTRWDDRAPMPLEFTP